MHVMLQNKKALLFDMDGTLLESMHVWKQIDVLFLGKFGLEVPKDLQKAIEGFSFHETAVYFRERFSLPLSVEEIEAEWNRMAEDQYLHHIRFHERAEEFLRYAKASGFALGICTTNSRELVDALLNERGLGDIFDVVITGTEVKKGKPAPDIYLAAAEALKVEPARCLVFEDILPGIMAGLAAGMEVCAVRDSFSMPVDQEKRELANYYLSHYAELLEERKVPGNRKGME